MSLVTQITTLVTRVATEVKAIRTLINGNVSDLSALTTTAKTNLVAAINEVDTTIPIASTTVTGPPAFSAAKVVGVANTFSRGDHIHGLPADAVTLTNAVTLTAKRITRRVLALSANSATPAVNSDNYDIVHITGQIVAITSFTMTGTPVDGDQLRISITGAGAVAITWGASFEASSVALPTTTVAGVRLDVAFFRNTETSKWRCVGFG